MQFGTNVATDSAIIKNDRVVFELNGFTYNLAGLHATDGLVVGLGPLDTGQLTIANGNLIASSGKLAADAASMEIERPFHGHRAVSRKYFELGLGTATVEVQGNIVVGNRLIGNPTSTIDLLGGRVAVGSGPLPNGGSTLRINSDGGVAYSGIINGDVINNGSLASNGSPAIITINGDYLQEADGQFIVEINGLTPGTEHDQLFIDGMTILDGELELAVGSAAMISLR